MNDTPSDNAAGLPGWMRWTVVGGLAILAIATLKLSDPPVTAAVQGDTVIYTSASSALTYMMMAGCVLGLPIAGLYVAQGVSRFLRAMGVALLLVLIGFIYQLATMDVSNHHVSVSPTKIVHEVGTRASPIRHEIDLTKTAYLRIDQARQGGSRGYQLVALAAADSAETRIPIGDLLQAALPRVFEMASEHEQLIVVESDDGLVIPTELRMPAPVSSEGGR